MPADPDSPIEVRQSSVHGLGAFATQPLQRGREIGEYLGRRYAPGEMAERDWDNRLTYVFGLSDGSIIDGAEGGNATRHLNHSCAPNCQAYEVEGEDGVLRVVIEARRRIRAGDELFIDYALDIGDDDPADFPCHCGAPKCRGTMAARRRAPRSSTLAE
jgi:SET domain-containing protein